MWSCNKINNTLKKEGAELRTARTDGVCTIARILDNKVIGAIHPVTRRFWIKMRNKMGVNGDFVTLTSEVMSFNELKYCVGEALKY